MNCSKCNTKAIKNQAGGKEFWYCRSCKDEVKETQYTKEWSYATKVEMTPRTGALFPQWNGTWAEVQAQMDIIQKAIKLNGVPRVFIKD